MKPIKLFYQARCPFCKRAFNYIDELKKRPEYKDIIIETIEETEQDRKSTRLNSSHPK